MTVSTMTKIGGTFATCGTNNAALVLNKSCVNYCDRDLFSKQSLVGYGLGKQ
jgi:hypothetical protein